MSCLRDLLDLARKEAERILSIAMPTRIIKSVPAPLHARLKRTGLMNISPVSILRTGPSYWGHRPLVPTYASALAEDAFADA